MSDLIYAALKCGCVYYVHKESPYEWPTLVQFTL